MHDDASGIVATLAPYLSQIMSAARFMLQLAQRGPAVPMMRTLSVLIERAGFRMVVRYSSKPDTTSRAALSLAAAAARPRG